MSTNTQNLKLEVSNLRAAIAEQKNCLLQFQLDRAKREIASFTQAEEMPQLPQDVLGSDASNMGQVSANPDARRQIFARCQQEAQRTGENLESLLDRAGYALV